MSYQPADPVVAEHAGELCLIGHLHADGNTATVVAIADRSDPAHVLALLRGILADVGSDMRLLTEQIMTHGWTSLDPAHRAAEASAHVSARLLDLGEASVPAGAEWLYLLGDREPMVLVYEATVHGTWARHSRHGLLAPADTPLPGGLGTAGDLATGHREHQWRPATVGLAGLRTSWQAEICSTEWARGVIVARLAQDVLRDVIDVTREWNTGRMPGSGLPSLTLVEHVLIVLWFNGSGHEQTQQITPGVGLRHAGIGPDTVRLPNLNVHYTIGQHVLPWTLPTEERLGYRPDELRNGVPPIREWITEAGLHAAYPPLRGYPLSLIAAALADLADNSPAALASYDHPYQVCLVAGGHGLIVAPTAWNARSHVTLPRPLGGTWTEDPLVPVFSPWQVATHCRIPHSRHH
ncbi:hypothetical protein ACLQ29_31625 [Micromonospora sp. DT228]|uniref:hypothetical protein n=1 Tax=Micromonospora sp. DT228 TaxID=3393443 RepID=UPI003CEBA6A1